MEIYHRGRVVAAGGSTEMGGKTGGKERIHHADFRIFRTSCGRLAWVSIGGSAAPLTRLPVGVRLPCVLTFPLTLAGGGMADRVPREPAIIVKLSPWPQLSWVLKLLLFLRYHLAGKGIGS